MERIAFMSTKSGLWLCGDSYSGYIFDDLDFCRRKHIAVREKRSASEAKNYPTV